MRWEKYTTNISNSLKLNQTKQCERVCREWTTMGRVGR